jgi:hypothetical protein
MKKLVFTFGRMNPPTIGHEKLANKIKEVARKENANPRIYLSHTQNPKKDPLSYNDKFRFAKKAFGIVQRSQSKQIFQILPEIEKEGFTDIIMVVGSDRIGEFDRVLQKYNGKDYNFNSIKTVSSGDRDPDAQGVEGMSGSKLRGVAVSGDEKTFKSGLASKLSDADKTKIYNLVRKNLKEAIMNEWTEEDDIIAEEALAEAGFDEKDYEALAELGEMYELNEVLNISQRIAKSRVMRRIGKKLARARKIASKKMKGTAKIAQLAKKAAIKLFRKKLGGKKGEKYASLSPSDKMNIDKKVAKKKSVIAKMAQRLIPKVRKDAMARVQQARRGPQNNEYVPEGVGAGKYSAMNLKKARELMSPAKHRKDGIERIMKGMKVSYKQATKFHDDVMKSYGFKPESYTIEEKYDLYHSTFSGAMQHAYDYAKKKYGIQIPPSEIDDKVATGPKKPGTGKTNTYRLKGRGGNLQIQVYNKGGSKPFELNMYKEEKDRTKTPQDPDIKDREGTQPKPYFKGVKKSTKDDRDRAFKKGADKHHKDSSAYPDSHPGDKGAKTKLSKHTKKYRDMFGEGKNMKATKVAIDREKKLIALRHDRMRDQARTADTKIANRKEDTELDEMIPKSTMYALVQKGKVVAKGSKSDMMSKKKKEGGTVYNAPSKKVGDAMKEAIDYSAYMTEDATAALKKKAEKSGIPLGILRQVYNRGMAAWRTGHRPGASQQQWAFARVNSFITKGSGTWGKADKDLAAKVRGVKSKKEGINEVGGAGEEGTKKLLAQYKKDTPGESYNPDDDFSGKIKKFKDFRKRNGFDSVREDMQEKLTRGQQSKLDDLEAYLGHLQRVSMTPSRRAEIEATKKKIKKLKSEETGDMEEMTGINVPELIKTTIHRLTHPKGYADIIKDYIKRVKGPHRGTNGAILSDIARERGFNRVKPIQDYINSLINKGKLPKELMASHCREEVEIDEDGCPIDLFDHVLEEAEYQGKKVTLNDPVRSSDGNKKFHVYVKNEKGNVIKLGFGDPNMEIKRDDPARRKSFRARHNCDNPGPKYKARYWSCYQWRGGAKVDN